MTGQVIIERFGSEALRGNPLGDPAERDVYVYLPPGYENDPARRFPVVYCLTGFAGRGRMLLNAQPFAPNLAERMDRLLARGAASAMILVMPDCFTRLGGAQYINSTAVGRYEDYLIEELVPFVDGRFRTQAEASGRAVAGKSSGGYGALVHAMRHPDIFGAAAAHSGDCYFEYGYLSDFPKARRAIAGDVAGFVERFWAEEKKGKDDFAALNIIAMSACYAPDPAQQPLGFEMPFNLETGEIKPAVWSRWLEHDPVRLVEKFAANLRQLKLLFIDAGTRDEYGLDLGARILCERLRQHQVPFVHEEFNDGHFNTTYRYDRSLTLLSEALSAED